MRKIFTIILVLLLSCLGVNAKKLPRNFTSIINNAGISEEAISISVRNADTGKVVYTHNDKMPVHIASVQKAITIIPIMEVLGNDYLFSTKIYSRGKDGYLLKLGADPYLSTSDLNKLITKIDKETAKNIYIDDYIIERKSWGEGWQWDDDLNTSVLKFNSYNLDKNIIKLTVIPTKKNEFAKIINPSKFPFVFINTAKTGDITNLTITRDTITAPNAIKVEGTVNTPFLQNIPINDLKRYFDFKLVNSLEQNGIYLKEAFLRDRLKNTDKQLEIVQHSVDIAIDDVLKNSNNMVIETMFKLAASKKYNKQGTDIDGIKLFKEFCDKNNIDSNSIKIVDASGVSKNNLLNADFVTEFLIKNKENKVYEKMASPGEGTLTNRMLPVGKNLKAKTGTLSDISSIAGFLTSKSGNKYAFCIVISEPVSNSSEKKLLEDYLMREMYLKL